MKKVNVLTAFLSLLVLLSSCAGPLTGSGGTFTLKVNLSQGTGGRTVVPDLGDAVKSYRLNLTSRSGHVPREMVSQGSTLTFESLHAGIWDLQGQALDADGTILAEKTLTGQTLEASGTLELTLALAPTVRTGTGTLDLILQWPESSGVDGLTVSLLTGEAPVADPQPQVIIPTFVAGSSRTAYILRTDLEAGTYSLVLNFTRAGKDAGTFREAVNISADLITRFWIDPADGKLVTVRTFTAGDFLGAQTNLAGLVVNGIVASDFTFTSETTAYIIPKVPTSKPLTFTATQGMPGQNLEYQWNTEETWQTGVFSALSRPLTLKAGDNKLTLKVTAPDRTNFKTYTLTFHWTPSFVSPTGMEMVQVDGGTFQRDAVATNLSTVDTFLLGRFEVTQAQWLEVMGNNPSFHVNNLLHPAENMSWYATLVFCNKLSIKEGLTPVYSINNSTNPDDWGPIPTTEDAEWSNALFNPSANGYRLPTVDEWRWAAMGGLRDGQPGNFMGGINTRGYDKPFAGFNGIGTLEEFEKYAYHTLNSSNSTHPVGEKLPNELGIYDLSGNVWEILWNWNYAHNDNLYLQGALRNSQGYKAAFQFRTDLGASFDTGFSPQSQLFNINTSQGSIQTTQVTNNTGLRVARNTSPLLKLTYNTNVSSPDRSFTEAYPTGATTKILGNASSAIPPAGKVFNRWSFEPAGTAEDYLPGRSYIISGSDKTLYAQWTDPGAAVYGRIIHNGTNTSPNNDHSVLNAVAVDSQGNSYIVGFQDGNSSFPHGSGVTAAGKYTSGRNAVLVKIDKFGQTLWARTADAATDQSEFTTVAVDSQDQVYVGGFQGAGEFIYGNVSLRGGNTNSGGKNAVILSYSSEGVPRWGYVAQGTNLKDSSITALVTHQDRLWVTGYHINLGDPQVKYFYDVESKGIPADKKLNSESGFLLAYSLDGAYALGRTASVQTEYSFQIKSLGVDDSGVYLLLSFKKLLNDDTPKLLWDNTPLQGGYNLNAAGLLKLDLKASPVDALFAAPVERENAFASLALTGDKILVSGWQGYGTFTYDSNSFTSDYNGLNAILLEIHKGDLSVSKISGPLGAPNFSHFNMVKVSKDGSKIYLTGRQASQNNYNYFGNTPEYLVRSDLSYLAVGMLLVLDFQTWKPQRINFLKSTTISYRFDNFALDQEGGVMLLGFIQSDIGITFDTGGNFNLSRPSPSKGNAMMIKYLP